MLVISAFQVTMLMFPSTCEIEINGKRNRNCFGPTFNLNNEFDLHVWAITDPNDMDRASKHDDPFWSVTGLNITDEFSEFVTVPVSKHGTRNNGSLILLFSLVISGNSPRPSDHKDFDKVGVTEWKHVTEHRFHRKYTRKNLLSGESQSALATEELPRDRPITHWKPFMKLRLITTTTGFKQLLPELRNRLTRRKPPRFKPIFYADELHLFSYHMTPLSQNVSREDPKVKIEFLPTSMRMFRFMGLWGQQIDQFEKLGMKREDIEQILHMVSPERIWRFALTTIISTFHSIFSFLAFKNDVGFFMQRESIEGLSRVSMIGNFICNLITLLYLIDNDTSILVVGTIFVETCIQFWKVGKVLKVQWSSMSMKKRTQAERDTHSHDVDGMWYLAWVLVPCVVGHAGYCLYHYQYKSVYSWFISSAAKSVYAFGFLMMVPQIWINYKLKSMAHLPWRALCYKFFSTFVDDAFAFLIEMPTLHRLATLRDDIIFFIYLYQRWIYPVDYTRTNEYGRAYKRKTTWGHGEFEKVVKGVSQINLEYGTVFVYDSQYNSRKLKVAAAGKEKLGPRRSLEPTADNPLKAIGEPVEGVPAAVPATGEQPKGTNI